MATEVSGFGFSVVGHDGYARSGVIVTRHGAVLTPAFVPVGTQGSVKTQTFEALQDLGIRLILGNTYHLYLRPGAQLVAKAGGLHRFTGWPFAIITDSGGYQLFSLRPLARVLDDGVEFQSHIDGSRHMFTPSNVIDIQHQLGADIILPLDVCTPYPAEHKQAARDLARTMVWAKQSRQRWRESASEQALFGVVQGSIYEDLRAEALGSILDIGFEGLAIGGLSVGEPKEDLIRILSYLAPMYPEDLPRHLLGVGTPEDILDAVYYGIDIFDCVLPTRNARNGTLFTRCGKMTIKSAVYAADFRPIDPACGCLACRGYTRAYIRHLLSVGEILGLILTTAHNLYFYAQLVSQAREAIEQKRFAAFRSQKFQELAQGVEALG